MPKVEREVVVQAPVDIVYRAWHNFENFPKFMDNIEEVRVVGNGRSHWKAKGPLGSDAEWDAETTLDEHNKALLDQATLDKVNALKADIIAGKIQVPDYYKQKDGK